MSHHGKSKNSSSHTDSSSEGDVARGDGRSRSTPVDEIDDDVFDPFDSEESDDVGEFFDKKWDDEDNDDLANHNRLYHDPKDQEDAVLDEGVHMIPGSPWAKPAQRPSNRPSEPLQIARYASSIAFILTVAIVVAIFIMAVWNYSSLGRVVAEICLGVISFFGLFWNSYFTVSSLFKCFIPSKAFKSNTKYCSVIPEEKPPMAQWLDVTIQIPVYKESLREVLMPTLKSCMKSRDHYERQTGATCNIVICDDGMMALLKNNFAAAEMLWETIQATEGSVFRLSRLLQQVPRPSRRHLEGLSSHSVYEVFHRMLFYYHYRIGFVARSTFDRKGKFKKASNLNTHLRLYWGAEQMAKTESMSITDALMREAHNQDGSRSVMFGNDVSIGDLILVNDADARMAASVIVKTVPEFLNDPSLGFTQHATKTMDEQRGESYYLNMLSVYTDALYQGHFLLSSILGCHPPLVGHSIFLRSDAVKQTGRIRTLHKTQRWLKTIGLPFLSVDQVGVNNLAAARSTEYWSENHVSEDFELMIHLYNLGFNGRYVAYRDCEFQEGITRTFDEEAGRHRKFALGAHELMFNPFNNWFGQGVFSNLFWNFLRSEIPSYYKVFLTAYLFSYTSGGAYLLVFSIAALFRILDQEDEVAYISAFNSAGVLVLSIVVYYVVGYLTFLITMVRMYLTNKDLFFPEYRERGLCYLIFAKIRYCMFFQLLFYSVMGIYFFLGAMDHLLSRGGVVSATNKDSITSSRCTALVEVIRFNMGSWFIALYLLGLSYLTILQNEDWDYTSMPEIPNDMIQSMLFAGPAALLAVMAFIVPILLNPYVIGWPFYPPYCGCRKVEKKPLKRATSAGSGRVVDLHTFLKKDVSSKLGQEMGRVQHQPDVELGSLGTHNIGARDKYPFSAASPTSNEVLSGPGPNKPDHKKNAHRQSAHSSKHAHNGGGRKKKSKNRSRSPKKPSSESHSKKAML